MIDRATRLADEQGELNNSFMHGKGNFAGYLGEEIFLEHFGGARANHHDFDIVYADQKIEVKTKMTKVTPKDYYMCSVSNFNPSQVADYYAFCRVNPVGRIGWICGFYPSNKYRMDATFHKKGEYDPDNDYYVKSDCWNLPISKLYPDVTGACSTKVVRLAHNQVVTGASPVTPILITVENEKE
jgi:hypothetical protein